jgi:hypothetical protein
MFGINVFSSIIHSVCFLDKEFARLYRFDSQELRTYNQLQSDIIRSIARENSISLEQACHIYANQQASDFETFYHFMRIFFA